MSAGTSSVDLTLATQSTRDLSGPLQAIPEVRGPDFSRQMDFEDSGCDLCEDMDRQEVTRSSSDLSGTASSLEMNTSSDSHESVSQTNLIVNYFPQELSESVFLDLFQSFGPTRNCKLVKDLGTGVSTSYGFVDYFKAEDAECALKLLNGLILESKMLKVSMARPQHDGMKGANLFVKNISKQWTLDELNELFREYGTIVTSRILIDNVSGVSSGVAFVRFEEKGQAVAAMSDLKKKIPKGHTAPLIIQVAHGGRSNTHKMSRR